MIEINQFRWNILMDTQEEYNCSGNSTIDWSTRGTVRPYFGVFCLIFALVTIPLYLLSAQVIWTLRRGSIYKVMFVLAVADILTLFVNSFTFGIFLIMGEVYCMHPTSHLCLAMFCQFFFMASSMTCILLAINRFGELLAIDLISSIFHVS
ncbi:hypothetical protein PENTCL1PPCAC_17139, partial [Pristionchus entomophagus]